MGDWARAGKYKHKVLSLPLRFITVYSDMQGVLNMPLKLHFLALPGQLLEIAKRCEQIIEMKLISLIFRLIRLTIDIRKFNSTSSTYHHKAKKIIDKLTASLDSELRKSTPSNMKLKLQWYMAEFIYSCEKFNSLNGLHSTPGQRESYLFSGALVGMCDLIIDDVDMEENRIKLFRKPDQEERYTNAIEKLYARCYHTFVNSLEFDIKERTIAYYEKIFDAQVKSKLQFNHSLTCQEIDQICKDKCGYTLLFLRSMVKGEMTKIEKQAWYELGGYIQYCNDAQDLYKDLKKNLRTFASVRSDLMTIAKDIDKQKIIAFSLIKETNFPEDKKDEFLLNLYVMGIGVIAKLHRFLIMCDNNFSFEKLSLINKNKVQSESTAIRLISYVLPKALMYDYRNVDKPYLFRYNL